MQLIRKIKKFFDKKIPIGNQLDSEEKGKDDIEDKIIENVLEENATKVIEPPEPKHEQKEDVPKEEEDDEEQIQTTKQENINLHIDLDRIQEQEDVVFEFYYNRIKVPVFRTIYELINYQPTHRSISDQFIIYYRILDRSQEKSEVNSETSSLFDEKKENPTVTKDKELVQKIKQNCKDLSPVVARFMEKYISPYIRPDAKSSVQNQNTNPYSYSPTVTSPNSSKIGVSTEEQRLISKKSLKICEALVYVLDQWDELRLDHDFIEKEVVVPKPSSLFKNLLDEYVQKIIMEPLNLILETKKNKISELFEMFMNNPHLLGFETRTLFYKTAAFAKYGEFHRSIHFLIQHLQKKHPNIPDSALQKQSKEKIKVDRKTLLKSAVNLLTNPGKVKRKNFLEIQY